MYCTHDEGCGWAPRFQPLRLVQRSPDDDFNSRHVGVILSDTRPEVILWPCDAAPKQYTLSDSEQEGVSMPYFEDEDVPKNVPEDKRAQWREVWNSVYYRALAKGATREEAEASAFRQANGVIRKGVRESWR